MWHRCGTATAAPSIRPRPARTACLCTTADRGKSTRSPCPRMSRHFDRDVLDSRRCSPRTDRHGNLEQLKRTSSFRKMFQLKFRLSAWPTGNQYRSPRRHWKLCHPADRPGRSVARRNASPTRIFRPFRGSCRRLVTDATHLHR